MEFDSYTIYPKLWYLSDYTPLIVDISIIEEFIPDKWCTIIKNSEEKDKSNSEDWHIVSNGQRLTWTCSLRIHRQIKSHLV